MPKPRQPIDTLIDAHVALRQKDNAKSQAALKYIEKLKAHRKAKRARQVAKLKGPTVADCDHV